MKNIWVSNVRKRLSLQKSLTKKEQAALIRGVRLKSPFELGRSGIYLTPNPLLVVLGASPGNSKYNKVSDIVPMAFGQPHPKIKKAKRSRFYWSKVRTLCYSLVSALSDSNLTKSERLTLLSHMNLAKDSQGSASNVRLKKESVSWVSHAIYFCLRPRVVVCFGLTQILKNPEIEKWWNDGAHDSIRWSKPHKSIEFKYKNKRYKFRVWETRRHDGQRMTIIAWPNHPSKPPFAGKKTGDAWKKALKSGRKIVNGLEL